ncbi:MAG: uroporphyrinogen-III synthase, partial [Alphaproteobacteria bacterium]|nr:uroporphyrinogen-III synthase [Alphaproteobacteria bacterium]
MPEGGWIENAMRSVLVTRPQPAAEEFAEKLRARGHMAFVAPMMEYVGVEAAFPDLAEYQALVFTSIEGVRHFSALTPARDLPVLAVGDATAAAAAKAGFAQVLSAKGNSAAVAALVKEEAPKRNLKKLLHPCSADTPDDISAALEGTGCSVVRRPVYKAALTETLPGDVTAALKAGGIDVVMLFSARTAMNFVKLLRQSGLDGESRRLEAVCISKAVAQPLAELRWKQVRVAQKPQIAAVMQALAALEKADPSERRRKSDRRARPPQRDGGGNVVSDGYTGPDRRHAARRAHDQAQKKRIWQEKMKFVNRS